MLRHVHIHIHIRKFHSSGYQGSYDVGYTPEPCTDEQMRLIRNALELHRVLDTEKEDEKEIDRIMKRHWDNDTFVDILSELNSRIYKKLKREYHLDMCIHDIDVDPLLKLFQWQHKHRVSQRKKKLQTFEDDVRHARENVSRAMEYLQHETRKLYIEEEKRDRLMDTYKEGLPKYPESLNDISKKDDLFWMNDELVEK